MEKDLAIVSNINKIRGILPVAHSLECAIFVSQGTGRISSFYLRRCGMSNRVFVGGNRNKLDPEVYCANCPDYKDRFKIARQIHLLLGTDGSWDFETCYKACVKKFYEINLRDRVRSRERYRNEKIQAGRI